LDDKNIYFYTSFNELKPKYFSHNYQYFYSDFTPFKVFHNALTIPYSSTSNFTKEIYQNHFNKSEIQDIILNSNDFFYAVERAYEDDFKDFIPFLKDLFEGNEKLLRKFLEKKIESTNLSVFEIIEDFRGLPYSQPNWFNNIDSLNCFLSKCN